MSDYSKGAAYIDGAFMPIAEAKVLVTHFGYRRSDVTYDVVGVWEGSFFRLQDHLRRFRASMSSLRMTPDETDDDIAQILNRLVALTGLKSAYVAMDCLRACPPADMLRHSANAPSYLSCFAVPWVSIPSETQYERGMHMIISTVQRISTQSVDPRVKNFHWGDFTQAQFEALDAGADTAVLLDEDGNVTEGPGFNVFMVMDGKVVSPRRGALEGITRKSVIELCDIAAIPHETRDITAAEFRNADEIFSTTTAGGVMPVSRIDGRIMGNDRPGIISSTLKDLFWQKRSEGWHATPVDYDDVAMPASR